MLATAITVTLSAISFKIKRLMPWFAMHTDDYIPLKASIKLDYLSIWTPFVPLYALKKKHWIVAIWCVMTR